jgi:hypothetical protein
LAAIPSANIANEVAGVNAAAEITVALAKMQPGLLSRRREDLDTGRPIMARHGFWLLAAARFDVRQGVDSEDGQL